MSQSPSGSVCPVLKSKWNLIHSFLALKYKVQSHSVGALMDLRGLCFRHWGLLSHVILCYFDINNDSWITHIFIDNYNNINWFCKPRGGGTFPPNVQPCLMTAPAFAFMEQGLFKALLHKRKSIFKIWKCSHFVWSHTIQKLPFSFQSKRLKQTLRRSHYYNIGSQAKWPRYTKHQLKTNSLDVRQKQKNLCNPTPL